MPSSHIAGSTSSQTSVVEIWQKFEDPGFCADLLLVCQVKASPPCAKEGVIYKDPEAQ